MLAGLEDVDEGSIRIGDRDVTNVSPKDRDIAMVFQNYALYPHMTVAQNMGFALKIAGEDKTKIRERIVEAAKILDLEQYLDRKPKALSGGQRQRVAMGRAIVRSPQVFLMDEPLSNLDAKLRVQTRAQIAALQRRLGVTTVYVTHDQVEAMTMGDRVAVLKDGILMQVDTPRRMYDHPNNVFVAGFIGSPAMNLLEVPVTNDALQFGQLSVPVPRDVAAKATAGGRRVTVGIRPEDMELVGDGQGIRTTVNLVEELGADAYIYGSADVNVSSTRSWPGLTGGARRRPPRPCTWHRTRATCTCSPLRRGSASATRGPGGKGVAPFRRAPGRDRASGLVKELVQAPPTLARSERPTRLSELRQRLGADCSDERLQLRLTKRLDHVRTAQRDSRHILVGGGRRPLQSGGGGDSARSVNRSAGRGRRRIGRTG